MHLISDGFGVYTIQITDVSSVLQTHDREEGTQLRSTGPRSARPCWIDGPRQQDSSDELLAWGVLGINSLYTSGRPLLPSHCQRCNKTGLDSFGEAQQ